MHKPTQKVAAKQSTGPKIYGGTGPDEYGSLLRHHDQELLPESLIQGYSSEPSTVNSLNQLGPKIQPIARYLNSTGQFLSHKSGTPISMYMDIEPPKKPSDMGTMPNTSRWIAGTTAGPVQAAQPNCHVRREGWLNYRTAMPPYLVEAAGMLEAISEVKHYPA